MATLKEDAIIVAGIAIAVIVIAFYAKKKVGEGVTAVLPYIDPTADTNIAYQGASALARWLTGQADGTLGTIVWDYAHKAEPAPGGGVYNYTAAQQAADLKAAQQLQAGYHGM